MQGYVDQMGHLLLDRSLLQSQPLDEVRTLARAQTLTVLGRLGPKRKRSVLQFLYESQLIRKDEPVVRLNGADLSGADLAGFGLLDANLNGAYLTGADLSGAVLCSFNGTGTDLVEASQEEVPVESLMRPVGASSLEGADLSDAKLRRATLAGCNLVNTKLRGASFDRTDIRGADLELAKGLSQEQVNKAYGAYQQEKLPNTLLPEPLEAPAAWSKLIHEQRREMGLIQ